MRVVGVIRGNVIMIHVTNPQGHFGFNAEQNLENRSWTGFVGTFTAARIEPPPVPEAQGDLIYLPNSC